MKKIAHISISSFIGSFDGEHYYGNLRYKTKSQDLMIALTEKQAKHLNEKDGEDIIRPYKKDDMTERFETEEDIHKVAKEMWREFCPEAEILIADKYSGISQIIDGDDKGLVKKLNKLWRAFEALYYQKPNYSTWHCKDEDKAVELEDEFQRLIQ